jgi:hypothetical protein
MKRIQEIKPSTLSGVRIPWCGCADTGCPVHAGTTCKAPGVMTLHRSDMEDRTGVVFCEACGEDALESGVFG